MLVKDILDAGRTAVSFEFFPPRTEAGWDRLFHTIHDLEAVRPAYVSVTYGAGGSTRDRTHQLIARLLQETSLEVVAHLTCVGAERDDVARLLDHYDEMGVHNILALRGDLTETVREYNPHGRGFSHASELVSFIRARKPHFGIGVAGFPEGHPATPNRLAEMEHLKAKTQAGADYVVTQLFFDNRDFYDFTERCEIAGITVPVVAGVMPVTSLKTMTRMAELAAGARFPAPLLKAVGRAGEDDAAVEKVGIHWATEQVRDLVDQGVRGVHLYTLNSSRASLRICENLGLEDFARLN